MLTYRSSAAFTLLELLIVIGILLILASIGVENYRYASIRARTARVEADLRTYASAVEAYRVDRNTVPRMAHFSFYRDPDFDSFQGIPVSGVFSKALSTPVAYISQVHVIDPFMEKYERAPIDERLYTYQVLTVYVQENPSSSFWPLATEFYGDWRIGSVGPDQIFDHKFINSSQLPYDPTNGVVSLGNIWRSQRNPQELPPIPELLGEH